MAAALEDKGGKGVASSSSSRTWMDAEMGRHGSSSPSLLCLLVSAFLSFACYQVKNRGRRRRRRRRTEYGGTEEEEEEEEEEEQRSCVLLSCCGSLILLTHSTSLSIEMKCSPGKKDPNAS